MSICCLHHHDAEKAQGSFGEMGQDQKKFALWDSSVLILGKKKSEILLQKKTLNLTNVDPGSGQNLADSGL
jgi:hypothetical protein